MLVVFVIVIVVFVILVLLFVFVIIVIAIFIVIFVVVDIVIIVEAGFNDFVKWLFLQRCKRCLGQFRALTTSINDLEWVSYREIQRKLLGGWVDMWWSTTRCYLVKSTLNLFKLGIIHKTTCYNNYFHTLFNQAALLLPHSFATVIDHRR